MTCSWQGSGLLKAVDRRVHSSAFVENVFLNVTAKQEHILTVFTEFSSQYKTMIMDKSAEQASSSYESSQ